ncbi:MAG: hypothetical protein KatS3mg110_0117 [Pirellulaceae bacterium]|nr:MAG: hypothetical protein KatS3mg110_0117 [Pirellulaceae bacterium]
MARRRSARSFSSWSAEKFAFWSKHVRAGRRRKARRFVAFEQLEDRRLLAANPRGFDNLGAELGNLVADLQQGVLEPVAVEQRLAEKADHWYVDGDRLYVEVRGRGDYETFLTAVQDAGLQVRASWPQPLLAEGFVSVSALPALASLQETISVLPVYRSPVTDSQGAASNAAENTLGAALIRDLFNIDGSGVTVGVISDSANQVGNGLNDSISTGDLPPLNVGTFLDIDGPPSSSDEGRAMMELIYDIAPGSKLRFASGIGGEAAFATAVNTLVTNGANIIVDDLNGLTIEPYFFDGVAAQAVANAVSSGVHYFSSAGNRGAGGYETPYREFVTGFLESGWTVHDFDSGTGTSEFQSVTLPAGDWTFVFQYDQFWGSVTTDMDFLVWRQDGIEFTLLASGTDNNTSTQVAREIVNFSLPTTTTVKIMVRRNSGPVPTRWKYIAIGSSPATIDEWTNETGAIVTAHNPGHNAVAGAMSVAAANAATPTTPASYSSVGPVTRVFDSSGNRFFTVQVRNKPDFTSNDGVNTTVPGFGTFFGTSAAAPNAAALAALLLDFQPSLTTSQLTSALQDGAQDIFDAGYDFKTGFGLINGFSSIMQLTGGVLPLLGDRDFSGQDDRFELRLKPGDSSQLEVLLNGSLLGGFPVSLINSITVSGLGGDDVLVVDFGNGNPIPTGGIFFDGGTNGAVGDRLEVVNGSAGEVVHLFTGASSGEVTVDGRTIIYDGLEPILDNLSATNRQFTFTAAVSDATLTRVSGTLTRIDSGLSESVDFATPSNSLTINLANGTNVLSILGLADDYNTPTNTINGGTGSDTINFETTGQAGVNWSVVLGSGDDTVNVSPVANNLANIAGTINVNSGSGNDAVNLFDQGVATGRSYLVSSSSITIPALSGFGVQYSGTTEVLNLTTTTGDDTVTVQSTNSGTNTTINTGSGIDSIVVGDGQQLAGVLNVAGGAGTDVLSVALPTGIIGSPIFFDGGSSGGISGGRDEVRITNQAAFRSPVLTYTGGGGGSEIVLTGLGSSLAAVNAETVKYNDTTGTSSLTVQGTPGDDLLTVAPVTALPGEPVLVFNNAPADASGPFNGPPENYFTRLPGVAGGSSRPDLYLEGLLGFSGLTVSDPNGNNRLYVYGQSDNALSDGNAFDPFGFGSGVLLPGLPGNAYDEIFVSDTLTDVNGFSIRYNTTDFIQAVSGQPSVVINAGFEQNPPITSGIDIADDIFVDPSANYVFRINGGDPDPGTTGIVPPDGDRLSYFVPGNEVSIWSDKSTPPVVSIGAPGFLPVQFTSIENTSIDFFAGGTLNLVGDNNDPLVDQPDHFVVIGRDVDGFADDGGFQEMEVRINGSSPLLVNGVSRLNVLGDDAALTPSVANDVDTLQIRPYADNTPQGWGVEVFFNEGNPAQTDGNAADLLIYQTSLFGGNVSENIVIQPSGPENGEIRVTNDANGTPITTISYVANLDIVVIDDDGSLSDTDRLTLRGTASSTPQASGRELFDVDLTRAGTAADPMIVVTDLNPPNPLAPILYRVRSVTGIRHIDIQTLDGQDVIQVRPVPDASFFVDGGPPPGTASGRGDVLNVITGGDGVVFGAGPQSDEGTFYVGTKRPLSFDNIEQLLVDTAAYVRPDSHESNDTIGLASVLGSLPQITINGRTLHGTTGSASPTGGTTTTDVDFYRYTANRTGYLVVNLLFAHASGDLRLDIFDGGGNLLAAANTATDNEQLIVPVVSQQNYFVRVASVDQRPTTYDLELENFAAPLPTAIDLEDNFDSGRLNTDNVTRLAPVDLLIHADLSDFAGFGIPVLTAAQAAAGVTPGVAVEIFRNGVSLGFADPVGGLPDLFRFSATAAQLLGGIATGSPVGPVAANAFGYQNLFTAAVRVFDPRPTPATGRTTATARLAVTYDPNAPDPALASIELLAASDSNIAGDGVTNINQPAFWGVGEVNTRVRIYASRNGGPLELVGEGVVGPDRSDEAVAGRTIGGKLVGGLSNDGLGLWEVTVEPLADGTYSFVAVFEDLAGNITPTSGPGVSVVSGVVVDTLPPQRPTIDLLDADDTGSSDKDNVTIGNPSAAPGQARFRISAEPNSLVQVKDGEVVIATFTFNAAFDLTDGVADGFGVLTIDFVANQGLFNIPAEGPHPLSVESFDLAGNRSAQAEELLVTVDFTPPAPPTTPDLVPDSDTGLSDSDNVTRINELVLFGLGEANGTVRIVAQNVVTGTFELVGTGPIGSDESDFNPTDGLGVWQLTLAPLDDGVYDLFAVVEDLAGNVSASAPPLRVEIDTTAPNLPFIDLVEADDRGRSNDDNITNVPNPRFTLTTEDPLAALHTILFPGGENLRYRLFDRLEGGVETLIYDSLVALGGLTPLNLVNTGALALADGVHNLKLEVEDRAGNISQDFVLTVVIDTVAPPVTILGILNTDTGVEGFPGTFADRVTSDTLATFVGRAEADAIVRLYVDGREGINNNNGVIDNPAEFALTVAQPFDGDDALPQGQWQTKFIRDLNDPAFFDFDGVREVLVTAEDVAGNVSSVVRLPILVDTQGPIVTAVQITSAPAFDLFDPKPSQGPTPLVSQLSIFIQDRPNRSNQSPSFLYNALLQQVAENPGLYEVRGDATGVMPISQVQFFPNPVVAGAPASGEIRITFATPLPDDRFTLTISDLVRDPAGNRLDGETNTIGPLETPAFPSGDGQAGGNFVARFTIDSRPEIGTWAAGTMWIDTNGNGKFDPDNPDFVNRDLTYAFGFVTDDVFAGNFSPTPTSIADGFDKLAVFGRVGTTFRWLIDTDNDGTPDLTVVDPTAPNGLPIAGNFDGNAANGDEVGVFDGQRFFFDTDHDFQVNDPGGSFSLATNLRGYPVVGDFNGDGLDDLATWKDDTFFVDLAAGPGPLSWDGVVDFQFRFGFITTRERPVVADMDQDGFADFGLWVPDRKGLTHPSGAEWYWLISNGAPVMNRIVLDPVLGVNVIHFSPAPLGPDLHFIMGEPYALPVVGNFDPPLFNTNRNEQGFLATNLQTARGCKRGFPCNHI